MTAADKTNKILCINSNDRAEWLARSGKEIFEDPAATPEALQQAFNDAVPAMLQDQDARIPELCAGENKDPEQIEKDLQRTTVFSRPEFIQNDHIEYIQGMHYYGVEVKFGFSGKLNLSYLSKAKGGCFCPINPIVLAAHNYRHLNLGITDKDYGKYLYFEGNTNRVRVGDKARKVSIYLSSSLRNCKTEAEFSRVTQVIYKIKYRRLCCLMGTLLILIVFDSYLATNLLKVAVKLLKNILIFALSLAIILTIVSLIVSCQKHLPAMKFLKTISSDQLLGCKLPEKPSEPLATYKK